MRERLNQILRNQCCVWEVVWMSLCRFSISLLMWQHMIFGASDTMQLKSTLAWFSLKIIRFVSKNCDWCHFQGEFFNTWNSKMIWMKMLTHFCQLCMRWCVFGHLDRCMSMIRGVFLLHRFLLWNPFHLLVHRRHQTYYQKDNAAH